MTGIEFDKSDTEVLVVCHHCKGTWTAFAWTIEDAEQRAAKHEARCHPTHTCVRDRISKRHSKRRERAKTL